MLDYDTYVAGPLCKGGSIIATNMIQGGMILLVGEVCTTVLFHFICKLFMGVSCTCVVYSDCSCKYT